MFWIRIRGIRIILPDPDSDSDLNLARLINVKAKSNLAELNKMGKQLPEKILIESQRENIGMIYFL